MSCHFAALAAALRPFASATDAGPATSVIGHIFSCRFHKSAFMRPFLSSRWMRAGTHERLFGRWPVLIYRGFIRICLALPADDYIYVCFTVAVQLVGLVNEGSTAPCEPYKCTIPQSALCEDFFYRSTIEPKAKSRVGFGIDGRLRDRLVSANASKPYQYKGSQSNHA